MRVWAIWHGGANYSGSGAEWVESFPSVKAAKDEFDRRTVWGRGSFRYVNQEPIPDIGTPLVYNDTAENGGPTMWLFFHDPTNDGDLYPDRVMEYGKRGGITVTEA